MRNKMIIWALIIVLLIVLSVCLHKPSIHEATQEDLTEVYGIDTVLSERIVSYLDCNPEADIDDLIEIKGIGEVKLAKLKKEFKWIQLMY